MFGLFRHRRHPNVRVEEGSILPPSLKPPKQKHTTQTAIREGRPESTRAPTPAITAAAAAAATNAAAAPAAPANSDPNKSNRAARALRGKKGSGVVVEQELAAAPGLA